MLSATDFTKLMLEKYMGGLERVLGLFFQVALF